MVKRVRRRNNKVVAATIEEGTQTWFDCATTKWSIATGHKRTAPIFLAPDSPEDSERFRSAGPDGSWVIEEAPQEVTVSGKELILVPGTEVVPPSTEIWNGTRTTVAINEVDVVLQWIPPGGDLDAYAARRTSKPEGPERESKASKEAGGKGKGIGKGLGKMAKAMRRKRPCHGKGSCEYVGHLS